jgi:sulfoxide reductase heme-binding subunit YedZ
VAPLLGLTKQPRGFGVTLILAAMVPAIAYVAAMLGDLFYGTSYLGTDPVKAGEHALGKWTLRLLFATLLITPLRHHTGWNWLAKHRRTLGLLAFSYVLLHFLTWLLLDAQVWVSEYVGWADVQKDILKRPYITIGMLALVLMIPLALTSTKGMIARLGKRWRPLHRLIYVITVLGVVHFFMAVKKDITEPLIYAAIAAALLGWRVWDSRRRAAARVPAVG